MLRRTFTPLLTPLGTTIIAILTMMQYLPLWGCACLCAAVWIWQLQDDRAGWVVIGISVICGMLSALQLRNMLTSFAQAQADTNSTHTRIPAIIQDVDPGISAAHKRMATCDIYHGTSPRRYRVGVPQQQDIQAGDVVVISRYTPAPVHKRSFAWYLLRQQYAGYLHAPLTMHRTYRPWWSLTRWITNMRNRFIASIYEHMPRPHADIVSHIFLGYKSTPDTIRDRFAQWGLSHMLARSGLHVVTFTMFCTYLIGWIPGHFIIRELLVLLVTIVYAALSWSSVSFLRAMCMLGGYYLCRVTYARYRAHHWVVLTAVCLLCYNPLHLFFMDFQLSFSITFALCWTFQEVIRA